MKSVPLVFLLSLSPISFVYGQGASGIKAIRLGTVNVHNLPKPTHQSPLQAHPFLTDDPELFQGEKLQAQNGNSAFPAASISEIPSTLVVNAGFAGLTFS